MRARGRVAALALTISASCALPRGGLAPGMHESQPRAHAMNPSLVELARREGSEVERPLLVVYPRSACSASASAVLVDAQGNFVGALAPGTAALLSVPRDRRVLTVFSSVEVTASVRTRFLTDEVALPPAPGGLIVRSWRVNARHCGSGQYVETAAASKEELEQELEESEVRWLEVRKEEGQGWLDAHRPRIDELLDLRPAPRATAARRVAIP